MPRGLFGRRARLPDKEVYAPPAPPPPYNFPMGYTGPTLETPGVVTPAPRARINPFGEMDLPFAGADEPQQGLLGPMRGVAPPSAPQVSQAELDNLAAREAIQRAREALRSEGYPIFNDPAYQQSGQAMADAVDQNRAATAEMQRRQSIPFSAWWHHRGRQDANHEITPEDQNPLTRYRWGEAPDPNQLGRHPPPRRR